MVELDSTYEKIHSLPHLSAFEAAARLGSFSAAADELFLTTGAVSRHIRSLEAQLGITLFYRGHKSVRLTQAGENFSRTASRVIGELFAAESALKASAAGSGWWCTACRRSPCTG